MLRTISATTVLLATFYFRFSFAYDIAFTDDDTKLNGYEYHFAFLARIAGQENCNRLPIDLNIEKGPRDVLVRARTGNTPVPSFIALYNNASPQLGICNNHSLLMILAFDPNVFDKQQLQKVRVRNIRYWKEIDFDWNDPYRDYASTLLARFRPRPGQFLIKDITTSGWRIRGTDLRTLGWNEGPVLQSRLRRGETVSVVSEESEEPEESEEFEWEDSDDPYTDSSTHLSSAEETDGGANGSDFWLLDTPEVADIFDFWLPDTPPEIRSALGGSNHASISPGGVSEIPVDRDGNPFEDFVGSLGSLLDFLGIDQNHQQVENDQSHDVMMAQNENAFYHLPHSESFPEDIDFTAFQESPKNP
ncbi:hypothetical protein TWF506_011113 [Arthrobotrys conoides]|uniref:Uncharacterized protein n=1 Tax=Arthrobotrys conoides TaxID=74498 RepID=A0AAN8RTW5_9PEZI